MTGAPLAEVPFTRKEKRDPPTSPAGGATGTAEPSALAEASSDPDLHAAIPEDADLSFETLPEELWETAQAKPTRRGAEAGPAAPSDEGVRAEAGPASGASRAASDDASPEDLERSEDRTPPEQGARSKTDAARRAAPSTSQAATGGRRAKPRGNGPGGAPVAKADVLDLPEDADEGIKDTMAALRSLFPGRPLSVETPNDDGDDVEPVEVGAVIGVGDLPTDPDAAERDVDDDPVTLPRRAANPGDGVT